MASSNPFYVEPPNAFAALMAGMQGFDSGRKVAKEAQLEDAYKRIGGQVAAGGVDNNSLGEILAMGPSAAPLLTAVGSLGKNGQTDTLKNLAAENASRASRGMAPLSPLDYQTAVANAGTNKSIINMPPQEKAYDSAMGKELADMNVGIIKGAANARSNLSNLDQLQQLVSDPSVYQGFAGERVLQAKKVAKSLGIDVGELGGAEAIQSISNQLALNARNPAGGAGMPGAMSDSDRMFLKEMQPGLEKTPQGNAMILDVNRKLNQRALEVENLRQSYIKKNGRLNEGFYRDLNDWSNSNPLFNGGQPRAAAQPAQAPGMQAAPKQAPDGNYYVPDPNRPGKYLRVVQ